MSTILRKRIFRIKRRARLKRIRSTLLRNTQHVKTIIRSMLKEYATLFKPYPTLHLLISESIPILVMVLGSPCLNLISLVGVAILSI